MVEKILKETYVNPKVELTQNDYNRLVELARMKAKKIEKRAREIYEKEGVTHIHFDGRFKSKRYGEQSTEHLEFECSCYSVEPSGEYGEETLFKIPQETRQRIATKVKRYVEEVFEGRFGEHMCYINAFLDLRAKAEMERCRFIFWTVAGWLLAVLMFVVTLFK
jgi:hypothetical protein